MVPCLILAWTVWILHNISRAQLIIYEQLKRNYLLLSLVKYPCFLFCGSGFFVHACKFLFHNFFVTAEDFMKPSQVLQKCGEKMQVFTLSRPSLRRNFSQMFWKIYFLTILRNFGGRWLASLNKKTSLRVFPFEFPELFRTATVWNT